MGEQNTSVNRKRTYNERAARTKRINRFVLLGTFLLYTMVIVNMILLIRESNQYLICNVMVLGLSIINIFVLNILFKKNPASETFRYVLVGGYTLIYSYLIFIIPDFYITITLAALLTGSIIYYDSKFINIFAPYLLLINSIRTIIFVIIGAGAAPRVEFLGLFMILLCTITIIFSTRIGGLFIGDMIGVISDERANIDVILSEVLEIASVVKSDVEATSSIINELNESTITVNIAVGEIVKGTSSVTASIINQTHMTGEIQSDIHDTENSSNKVVSIVKESSVSIEKSLDAFKQLKTHSEEIVATNENVSGAMNELQERVQAVNDIIGVIADVSDQTNLLALNASIEAARAGEAGKGFAVVADEIRNLAEQTRESTENITNILKELNNKASYASSIVNNSIDVTNKQSQSISSVSESIYNLHSNMSILSDDIADINKRVINVSNSNQIVVDNIGEVSAVCEEITASTEDASSITNKSKLLAERAVTLLNEVNEVAQRLNKY